VFRLKWGKLTLKIYSKGERVLRCEVIVHNTEELDCGRSLERFPEIVARLRQLLLRFQQVLSCVDVAGLAMTCWSNCRHRLTWARPEWGAWTSTKPGCAR
jgi:hypothetical protein